jgi:murein DD-endopeptidase MepM/ murein hydrolase activator NlpD
MKDYSENTYILPIKKDMILRIIQKESPAHVGKLKNSIDFLCNEGTPVVSAGSGTVVAVKSDSKKGGPDKKKYWYDGNYVVIKHANEEFTEYEHFLYRGVVVKVGDIVKAGQLIGYSGNTGFSLAPHLHFEVFVWPSKEAKPEERVTIKARIDDLEDVYESH